MTDKSIKAPSSRRANDKKHQRRASFHTRRRSQHSIASFGDIADDVIAAPKLGSLLEKSEEIENMQFEKKAAAKKGGKKHGRKQSNIHEFFRGEDQEEALQNVLSGLMEDENMVAEEDSDRDYSPEPLHLADASPSPREDYETYEESSPKTYNNNKSSKKPEKK